MRCADRLVCAALCHGFVACAAPAEGEQVASTVVPRGTSEQAAAEREPAEKGAGLSEERWAIENACSEHFCTAGTNALAAYCTLEHARCPSTPEDARKLACSNALAARRMRFVSSCGGESVRIQYDYGALDYHYDERGELEAVITVVNAASDLCRTDVYVYGEASCSARKLEDLSC